MRAPDKIYLHPDIGGRDFIRPWLHRAANSESVAYIRKDALLEWVKELKFHLKNRSGLQHEGAKVAIDGVIELIESL